MELHEIDYGTTGLQCSCGWKPKSEFVSAEKAVADHKFKVILDRLNISFVDKRPDYGDFTDIFEAFFGASSTKTGV